MSKKSQNRAVVQAPANTTSTENTMSDQQQNDTQKQDESTNTENTDNQENINGTGDSNIGTSDSTVSDNGTGTGTTGGNSAGETIQAPVVNETPVNVAPVIIAEGITDASVQAPVETPQAPTELPATEITSDHVMKPADPVVTETSDFAKLLQAPIEVTTISITTTEPTVFDVHVEPEPPAVPVYVFNPIIDNAFNVLAAYCEAMAGNVPQDSMSTGRQQRRLAQVFTTIINFTDDENFQPAFTKLLETIAANRGDVFADINAFRDIDSAGFSPIDKKMFIGLLTTFTVVADIRSRELALRQIDIAKVLDYPAINDEGRHRVATYFNIQ